MYLDSKIGYQGLLAHFFNILYNSVNEHNYVWFVMTIYATG